MARIFWDATSTEDCPMCAFKELLEKNLTQVEVERDIYIKKASNLQSACVRREEYIERLRAAIAPEMLVIFDAAEMSREPRFEVEIKAR